MASLDMLGIDHAGLAAANVATSNFDWATVLAAWGPSVPIFLWLLKMHRDVIQVVIPRGFRLIRREMRRQGHESVRRHEEHIAEMKSLEAAFRGDGKKKRSRKATPVSQRTPIRSRPRKTRGRKTRA